jgi:hypothetical protein
VTITEPEQRKIHFVTIEVVDARVEAHSSPFVICKFFFQNKRAKQAILRWSFPTLGFSWINLCSHVCEIVIFLSLSTLFECIVHINNVVDL